MKKLMIAAAAAAMIGSAQAIVCATEKVCEKDPCTGEKTCVEVTGAGIAHKVAISLKTTAIKGKTTKVKCEDNACTYWRQQATKKINGLLWEQLEDCNGCVPFGSSSTFWTSDEALDLTLAISVGMIGKDVKGKSLEAYGTLTGEDFGSLAWAGFGSATTKTLKSKCEDDECAMWVKSITGGIAGALVPGEWDNICQDCDPIEYDGCCEEVQLPYTAAYGTIKISYDSATSKKVAVAEDAEDPTSFYKFPKAIDADDIVVNDVVIEE